MMTNRIGYLFYCTFFCALEFNLLQSVLLAILKDIWRSSCWLEIIMWKLTRKLLWSAFTRTHKQLYRVSTFACPKSKSLRKGSVVAIGKLKAIKLSALWHKGNFISLRDPPTNPTTDYVCFRHSCFRFWIQLLKLAFEAYAPTPAWIFRRYTHL